MSDNDQNVDFITRVRLRIGFGLLSMEKKRCNAREKENYEDTMFHSGSLLLLRVREKCWKSQSDSASTATAKYSNKFGRKKRKCSPNCIWRMSPAPKICPAVSLKM